MVTRAAPVLLALLLAGCPDDVGQTAATPLVQGLLAPTSLAGVAGGSQVALSWTDHATTESGYRVEVNLAPFGLPPISDVRFLAADATALDYPATPGATYYFRVVAITATSESDPSSVLIVTMPPAQPSGVSAQTIPSPNQLSVAWSDVDGETGYIVERSDDGGISWIEAGFVAANAAGFISSGLAPDTRYAHRVTAFNDGGRSAPSAPAFAQTITDGVSYEYPPTLANAGLFNALRVPSPGVVQVAHYDAGATSVLHTSRFGTSAPAVTVTVDGGPTGAEDVGGDGIDLALEPFTGGAPPKAHVVAHDRTIGSLRYATNLSGSWVQTTVDSLGARPRIARDPASGTLHVAYLGLNSLLEPVIRHARKLPGQGWTVREFFAGAVDYFATHSLALDGSGRPHVLLVTTTGILVHAYEQPSGATASEQIPLPASHGRPYQTGLVLTADGTTHVIYHGSLSRSLHHLFRIPAGAQWQAEVIDEVPGEDLGSYCSAVVDEASGRLHVAYYDATRGDLKCATKDPAFVWVRRIIDATGDVGSHVSIASVGGTTLYFAYRDETQKRLKFAVKQF